VTAAQELEDDLANHSPQDLAEWKDQERRWLAHVAAHGTLPKDIATPYRMTQDDGKFLSLHLACTNYLKLQQYRTLMLSSKLHLQLLKWTHLLVQAKALLICSVLDLILSLTSQSHIPCCMAQANFNTRCSLHSMHLAQSIKTQDTASDASHRLARRIASWVNWRNSVYSTAFQVEVDPPEAVDRDKPEDYNLGLPSAITDSLLLAQTTMVARFKLIEFRLRHGVAEDGVREIRRQISIRTIFEGAEGNAAGGRPATRAQNGLLAAQDRVSWSTVVLPPSEHVQVQAGVWRFNKNYTAMEALQTEEQPIPSNLLPLTEHDTQSPHRYGPAMGDSTQPVSWIWGRKLADGETATPGVLDFWVKDGMKTLLVNV